MIEHTTDAVGKVIARKQVRQSQQGMAVMSLGEHLNELRRRVLMGIFGLLPIFILAMVFGKQLLGLLILPMVHALRSQGMPANLQATSVFETFGTYMLIAGLITLVIGFPWILYQAWIFVSPGLYEHEKRFVHLLLPMSLVLSVLGVVFMYVVVLPVLLAFFVNFTTDIYVPASPKAAVPAGTVFPTIPTLAGDPETPAAGQMWINSAQGQLRIAVPDASGAVLVQSCELFKTSGIIQQPKISDYVDQLVTFSLAFAAAFQAPVIVLLLGWMRFLKVETLGKYRRHCIMAIMILSALMTPPDPISIFLLAGPLYVLFEFGVILLRIFPPGDAAIGNASKVPE